VLALHPRFGSQELPRLFQAVFIDVEGKTGRFPKIHANQLLE
jgi:hypothetical protein